MQVPPDILLRNVPWQLPFQRRFDLPGVLAYRRRHPLHAKGRVNVFFGRRGDDFLVPEKAVFGEFQAVFYRDLPDGDVVRLRSGEVLEGGAPGRRPDDPEVSLEVAAPDRGLGRA